LEGIDQLPDGVYLSINASPQTAMSAGLADVLSGDVARRVQLEITEETGVDDYEGLEAALLTLRERDVRIAIDDAGAGYASLRHILRLTPDVIKLDMTLVRGIDTDTARAALASSLVSFASRVGATIVAEGVETQAELDTLADLGVDAVQGFLLARPGELPLPAITAVAG
jgi:EAL domain-containing protein (putative c-di-GMP-specific phosphodiesterase class I)